MNKMRKNKKQPILKRLFPHSPLLRIIFVLAVIIALFTVVQNVYRFYEIKALEIELKQEKEKLNAEKQDLEKRKEELNDSSKIEQKARDELGFVKKGELPYVR